MKAAIAVNKPEIIDKMAKNKYDFLIFILLTRLNIIMFPIKAKITQITSIIGSIVIPVIKALTILITPTVNIEGEI